MAEKNINKLSDSDLSTNEVGVNYNDTNEVLSKIDASADVMNLMEGVDTNPSEKISTRREKAKPITLKKPKIPKDNNRPLPSKNVIKRKVIEAMKQEEAIEIGSLHKLENKPYEYAEKVKKIRLLRQKLYNLLHEVFDKIKDKYLELFGDKHGVKKDDN